MFGKQVAVYTGNPDVVDSVSLIPGKQYVVEYLGVVPVSWNPTGGKLLVNCFSEFVSKHVTSSLPTLRVYYAGFSCVVPYSTYDVLCNYWSFEK